MTANQKGKKGKLPERERNVTKYIYDPQKLVSIIIHQIEHPSREKKPRHFIKCKEKRKETYPSSHVENLWLSKKVKQ